MIGPTFSTPVPLNCCTECKSNKITLLLWGENKTYVFHRQGYSDERNSVDVHVYCMFSEDSSVLCDGCRSDSGCDWVLRLSVHCVGHKHRAGRSSLSTGASSRQVGERTCCSPMQPYVVQPTSVVLDDTWKLSSTVTSFSGLRLTSWLKLLTNNRIDQHL